MTREIDEDDLTVHEPKRWAAGLPGIAVSVKRSIEQMGPATTLSQLRLLNQRDGFDCPGCAWPEPREADGHKRKLAEFCENGAKAVAEEATRHRVGPAFFAAHPLADLEQRSEYWLGRQGRLTHPVVKRPGADRYEEIGWDEAFDLVAAELRKLPSPDAAAFYTSGRTSNEAAFLYQLMVRSFGTNNLPDCSNMCHESSGLALAQTIGVGKGSVSLADIEVADLILVVGQNPGTNHPRMLTALEAAKGNGAKIIAVNPLPEAGLLRFKNPQKASGMVGRGTALADEFAQVRLGGDLALFQGLGRYLLEAEDTAPGTVLDRSFLDRQTEGFEAYAAHIRSRHWDDIVSASGLDRSQIEQIARMLIASERTIFCWAMGLTQHRQAVPTIREITNVALIRGMIGKRGAGLCPVRGHSNVQGDRTMGIWEKMPAVFLDRLGAEFGIDVPREDGLDTVDTLHAMAAGRVRAFFAVGGNFASATPDTVATERALRSCALTAHVSTKLNRSHVVTGDTALILPTLGRTERDVQGGTEQFVTVEDSMSVVHRSRGRKEPASPALLSEVSIVCRLARALLGADHPVAWESLNENYDRIREHIAAVVPGCDGYNSRVREPDGFVLPHAPRDMRTFGTASKRAALSVNVAQPLECPPGRLLLQTMRSHDQYNTTIYGLDDRYRGISDGRRVVLVNPSDLAALGIADGARVDLVSEFPDDPTGVTERRAEDFRVVAYPTARQCAASYFPETNALVPLGLVAEGSNTPVSKSLLIRLEPRQWEG